MDCDHFDSRKGQFLLDFSAFVFMAIDRMKACLKPFCWEAVHEPIHWIHSGFRKLRRVESAFFLNIGLWIFFVGKPH